MRKRTWKERIVIASILLFLMVPPAIGGVGGTSDYDIVWKITVIDCRGNTTVYDNCRITNNGQFSISFMPDQGLISSGNGKIIVINTVSTCTTVIREEVK